MHRTVIRDGDRAADCCSRFRLDIQGRELWKRMRIPINTAPVNKREKPHKIAQSFTEDKRQAFFIYLFIYFYFFIKKK